MIRIGIPLLALALLVHAAHAQRATVSTGGDAVGPGGSISFSAGQPSYTAIGGATGSLVQGVQQPYEISVSIGVYEREEAFTLAVGPNPATDELELAVTGPLPSLIWFNVRNSAGQTIMEQRINAPRTRIAMGGVSAGVYLVEVSGPERTFRTFRIVKH